MRSLAFEERVAYNARIKKDDVELDEAEMSGMSKSQIKKLKARQHNDYQQWLKENKIVKMLGRVFTEKETMIEGTEVKP